MNMALQLQKLFVAGIVVMLSILGVSLVAKAATAEDNLKMVSVKSVVKRGDILKEDNLKVIDSVYNKPSDKIITHIDDAANLEALRNLRPGNPIRFSYLRVRPMVREDSTIKAVFKKPGINLESEVTALEDGNKGDLIKIRNIKSNQIVTATVIGNNLVSVQ